MSRVGLPTGVVTLVFTEIEGSTRLLHQLGVEAYAEALVVKRSPRPRMAAKR